MSRTLSLVTIIAHYHSYYDNLRLTFNLFVCPLRGQRARKNPHPDADAKKTPRPEGREAEARRSREAEGATRRPRPFNHTAK